MEIIGPLNLLYILYSMLDGDLSVLPGINKLVAGLYVLHYVNRAVVSPFFMAPSMSPIHVFVVGSAMLFNWVNSTCLAGWVLGYRLDVQGLDSAGVAAEQNVWSSMVLPGVGLGLFVIGMVGNMYSERTLFRLRREEGDKRSLKKTDAKNATARDTTNNDGTDTNKNQNQNKYSKVYVIPPKQGVFRSILFPHYVFEWIEWFGFTLLGTAVFPLKSGIADAATAMTAPKIRLAPWLMPAAAVADKLHVPLPLPALAFVVNAVANMLPHARWGRKWYVEKFGEEAVGNRGVAIPWCPWM